MPKPTKKSNAFNPYEVRAAGDNSSELLIYGDIGDSWYDESVSAKQVVQQLQAVDSDEIIVRINSYGGSVADGLAIYNALRSHKATITVRIEGVAVSIASLIAMAGDSIEMGENALFMVHAPWGGAVGNSQVLREYADTLDKFALAMSASYARKTGLPVDEIMQLLTDGIDHWYTAAEAKEAGFVDVVNDAEAIAARGFVGSRFFAGAKDQPQTPAALVAASLRTKEHSMPKAIDPSATDPQVTNKTEAEIQAAIHAAEVERRTEIKNRFAASMKRDGVTELLNECLLDMACSPDAASQKLVAHFNREPQSAIARDPRIEVVSEERDHVMAGMQEAIANRANPAMALTDNGRRFRGRSMIALAERAIQMGGGKTDGMSPREIAVTALNLDSNMRARAGMHSTSDFPIILGNTVNRALRQAYEMAGRTFLPFCRPGSAADFREMIRAQFGDVSKFLEIPEGGEYQGGTIGESQEKYRVKKYGRKITITWEALINDDLDAFSRLPRSIGNAAAQNESDIVWSLLTGTHTMADTVALFHATHGNLAGGGGAINVATLAAGRAAIRKQASSGGSQLNLAPAFLMVGPDKELEANQYTSPNYVAAKSSDINTADNTRLQVIVEGRIAGNMWFLSADPSQIDTVEYAYLDGEDGLFIETRNGFEVDGLEIKARSVFGAKPIDHRGLYRNPGA